MTSRCDSLRSPAKIDFANSESFCSSRSIALEKAAHRLTVALETLFLSATILAVIRPECNGSEALSAPLVTLGVEYWFLPVLFFN